MNKIYPDATAALAGLLHDGMTICCGGFGLSGMPERLIDAIEASGGQGPHDRQQQRRHRRRGLGQAAAQPPGQEDDQFLRR